MRCDDPTEVADHLRGFLEIDIDCLVPFSLDVFGSNLQLPAELRPDWHPPERYQSGEPSLCHPFGSKLNPGKQGEIVALELRKGRIRRTSIPWWTVIATTLTPAFLSAAIISSLLLRKYLGGGLKNDFGVLVHILADSDRDSYLNAITVPEPIRSPFLRESDQFGSVLQEG